MDNPITDKVVTHGSTFIAGMAALGVIIKAYLRFHPKLASQAQTIKQWEERHAALETKMEEDRAAWEEKEAAREKHEKERDRIRAEKDKSRLEREKRMRDDIEALRRKLDENESATHLITSMGRKARIALLKDREKGIETALIYLEVFEDINQASRSGIHESVRD